MVAGASARGDLVVPGVLAIFESASFNVAKGTLATSPPDGHVARGTFGTFSVARGTFATSPPAEHVARDTFATFLPGRARREGHPRGIATVPRGAFGTCARPAATSTDRHSVAVTQQWCV